MRDRKEVFALTLEKVCGDDIVKRALILLREKMGTCNALPCRGQAPWHARVWDIMIKFVLKPVDNGWAIYRDGPLVHNAPTRRQALAVLSELRKELKASGQRSLIKLEPRLPRPSST